MVRLLFLAHRYLGIGIGLVMLLWTLSGIVMMYKSYPELSEQDRVSLLAPLDLAACCQFPASQMLRGESYSAARLEMLEDTPVLRLLSTSQGWLQYDLVQGRTFSALGQAAIQSLAEAFAARRFPGEVLQPGVEIHNDQWTVYGAYDPLRPLHRYRVEDAAGSEFYLSSVSGEVIQLTTAEQRFWGYLGAVVHWLYPTLLRQHTGVWAQVVIWLTIIGIFLTATGLYIGIRQYRHRHSGRLSPYRGLSLYHHYAGLVFGVLTLTWVFSGLFSMNPWGALEGEGAGLELQRLAGRELSWEEIQQMTEAALASDALAGVQRLELTVSGDQPVALAYREGGGQSRLDAASLAPAPLSETDLRRLAARLQPQGRIATAELLTAPDTYYYSHHEVREFPVFRVVLDEPQQRRYYLSPVSGQLLAKIDPELRWYRWLFYGLHRGDFTAFLRSRPIWDVLMLTFLLGVTLVCGSGCWMAWRRLT